MRFHLTLGLSILTILGTACREEAPTLDKQVLTTQDQVIQENDNLSAQDESSDLNTVETKAITADAPMALAYTSSDSDAIDQSLQGAALTGAATLSNQFSPALTRIYLASRNGHIEKGMHFGIFFVLSNNSSVDGEVRISPTLTSTFYKDFDNVSLGTKAVKIPAGGSAQVGFEVWPYLQDPATRENFAVGAGRYEVGSTIEFGKEKLQQKPWAFNVADTNAVLTLVLYDKNYFQVGDAKGADPEKWMIETFTRKSSVEDSTTQEKKVYAGGFDAIMNVRHIFKMVEVASSDIPPNMARQDQVKTMATKWTGMNYYWANAIPPANKHGFDYAIGLFNASFGGVRIGSVTAVSAGVAGDRTKGRMQMLIAHESGHMFGAPHCDPIKGYIMCSGEKNEAYKKGGEFVWHTSSIDRMHNPFLRTAK